MPERAGESAAPCGCRRTLYATRDGRMVQCELPAYDAGFGIKSARQVWCSTHGWVEDSGSSESQP
jgi:hypothetical protein